MNAGGDFESLGMGRQERAELGLGWRARSAAQILGEQQNLLDDTLANDRIVLVEAETNSFAVEDLVLDGAGIDLGAPLGCELRDAVALRLRAFECGEGRSVDGHAP